MCATFFINKQAVSSIGELRKHVNPGDCISEVDRQEGKDTFDLIEEECLCCIDPLLVALRLDKLVLCDPAQAFYTFKDRND
jgi:hypothetical protein